MRSTLQRALLAGLLGVSFELHGERLPLKIYTVADGLPHDTILAIHADSRGYLWFATREGLSRFDGIGFRSSDLPAGAVHQIVEAEPGIYWIASPEGVIRFDARSRAPQRTRYLSDDPKSRFVLTMLRGRDAATWCGTAGGLYRITSHSSSAQFVDIGLPLADRYDASVTAIAEDHAGGLWVGSPSGLYHRLPEGRAERYGVSDGLLTDHIQALLVGRDGTLWAATTLGLCTLRVGAGERSRVTRCFTRSDGLAHVNVRALLQTSEGKVWVGTVGGLSEWRGFAAVPHFWTYTTAHGLSDLSVTALAEDRGGNLWVGTESGGANRIAAGGFRTYGQADGLKNNRIAAVFEDRRGQLIAATSGVIHLFDGKRFTDVTPLAVSVIKNSGWGWSQLHLQDHLGAWWIATGEGLLRFPPGDIETLRRVRPAAIYTARSGLPTSEIFRLFEDSRGDIWITTVGATDSLAKWDRQTGRFRVFTTADGLEPFNGPTAFAEDEDGNLWIGFYDGGIARYRGGRFRMFKSSDDIPAGSIRAMFRDSRGGIWVAGSRGGVCRISDPSGSQPHFVRYSRENSRLSSSHALSITEDRSGGIYVGMGRGVDRLDPDRGGIEHFDSSDGLANNFINVAHTDRAGAVWFGTLQGLSRLAPGAGRRNAPGPMLISALSVGGRQLPLASIGERAVSLGDLSPNENLIQIHFLQPGDRAARYQFRLEGAESQWSPPTEQRSVTYAHLAPGRYRFRVRALDGQEGMVGFSVLPPLWQRWWFMAIAAVMAGSLIYAAYRYRLQRAIELERVRIRIATDLHDDIGASLSRIAILSEVIKGSSASVDDRASRMLSEVADSARALVDSMADIVWSIDPRRDDLKNVIQRVRQFAADVLEARQIVWTFDIPSEPERIKLAPEQRRHVFLVFKEAITNVARHAACTSAALSIRLSDHQLVGEIRDDGRGVGTNAGRGGHGLANMEARARELGGTMEINSAPGGGTRVKLTIPLTRHEHALAQRSRRAQL